jgi:hypothetical protein
MAFALDMIRETNNNFGVNEVLLSSVLAAVMFAIFAGQPLCIVGVTGNQLAHNKLCGAKINFPRANYSF